MSSADWLFLIAVSFVAGTLAGAIGISVLSALALFVLASLLVFFLRFRPSLYFLVAVAFLAGNSYYTLDDFSYWKKKEAFENVTAFTGKVIDEPRKSVSYQLATIKLVDTEAVGARVFARLEQFPELSYGDIVIVTGSVDPPPSDSYGNYMAKERIGGSLFYPTVEIIGHSGNPLFELLFALRRSIKESIDQIFTQREAAFMSGIMLGERDEFSVDFKEKLSLSGTMHLTALSGLNMTITVFIALIFFAFIFWRRKRAQFIATFSTVALFVAMTGFQVSALRAALMAFLVGLAAQTSRVYNPKNALSFSALVITVWNPKSPAFDLGFQLSFLATLAILYLAPAFKQFTFFQKHGVLGWREVVAITLAAQLGVAPLSIMIFNNFSLTGLLSNIAVIVVMPILTVLGFLVAAISFLYMPLAVLISKPTAFLADYVIGSIETFAVLYVPFNPDIGAVLTTLYYAILVFICFRWSVPFARDFLGKEEHNESR